MKALYSYQNDARNAVLKAVKRHDDAALIIMATGLGKTVVAGSIVQWWLQKKRTPILFLVHLWEAVGQADAEFRDALGPNARFQCLVGKAEFDPNAQVVFSTFQTMRGRYKSFPRDTFGLIIVDECHRSKAETYEPVVEYFASEFKLGMTATEERMDGRDVREIFGNPVYEYPLAHALADRALADVEYRVLTDNVSPAALRKIEERLGKGDRKITRAMIDRRIFLKERLDIIAQTIEEAQKTRRQTIIFCNSRRHANIVNRYFPDARTYYSGLKKHVLETRFSLFKSGLIKTLIVVNKLNEAVDVPDADLVVFLRMTESKTIWMQQLGRGLRKKKSKKNVLVLDFVANCDRIRIVGQLAMEIRKCLSVPEDSAEIHRTGLTFNFETQARNIFDLLKRIEGLPAAGDDGMLVAEGETWGTIPVFARMFKVSYPTVEVRVSSCRQFQGRVRGQQRTFYALSDVQIACSDLLENLPKIGRDGTFKADGETWGMIHVLSRVLKVSPPAIEARIKTGAIRQRLAWDTRNRKCTCYALADVRTECAELTELHRAGSKGTFKAEGETWGTPPALAWMLGISEHLIRKHGAACRQREGRSNDGNINTFYSLIDVRKACADFRKKIPQAGDDGTFIADGEVWGTIRTNVRILNVSESAIRSRLSSCRKRKGRHKDGQFLDYYSLSDVRRACSELLEDLPMAGKNGTFKANGETWGTSYAIVRILGLSGPVMVTSRNPRTRKGKNASGVVCTFYALADLKKAFKSVRKK